MSPYAKLSRGMSINAAFHLRGKDSFVRTREFQMVRLRRLLADGAEFRAVPGTTGGSAVSPLIGRKAENGHPQTLLSAFGWAARIFPPESTAQASPH